MQDWVQDMARYEEQLMAEQPHQQVELERPSSASGPHEHASKVRLHHLQQQLLLLVAGLLCIW